jgi:hypothetical protein
MKNSLWVVYRMGSHGKFAGGNAVCEQREWDDMERAHPGSRTLIQAGIVSEGEAERVARTSPLVGNTHETPEPDLSNAVVAEEGGAEPATLRIGPDDLLLLVHGEAG